MDTIIALLRGINVGGHHKLPMRELKALLEGMGLTNVQTYIQSGNAVFQSEQTDRAKLAQSITVAIEDSYGFAPQVFLLDLASLQEAITANPFPEGEAEPKSLHLFFLDAVPQDPDLDALEELKAHNERFALIDKVFYLHTPDGIGRSKLAEKFGRGWDVSITARNWRTVSKVMEMATAVSTE
ncbi:MAG: DUF1697 domain-containing protein [Anaerolineaceae bacterium]|nr:DUF1697 domain-containing protein [Anaerolineaceae bacterium]